MRLKLAEIMQDRRLSQSQIAAGLGISPAMVSSWLNGKVRQAGAEPATVFPSMPLLEALCVLLECTPSDLLQVEATATPSGKTRQDFGPPTGPGRPPLRRPEELAAR